MQPFFKLTVILLFLSTRFLGQNPKIDTLIQNELKMTFPGIYFEHGSIEYTSMPYSVDSCFKYIALHFDKKNNSLVIWHDSTEKEELTIERIKKLKLELNKYSSTKQFEITSMDSAQKVSRHTINLASDSSEIKHLLSLNSAFEMSKTRLPKKKKRRFSLEFIEIGAIFGG